MHELSIALSILEIAGEEAERRGNVHVHAIHLKIGPLSGVVKDALVAAYELAAEQTPFADCRLVIEDVPIVAYCAMCEAQRPVRSIQSFECAECGAPISKVLAGRELLVSALELAQ